MVETNIGKQVYAVSVHLCSYLHFFNGAFRIKEPIVSGLDIQQARKHGFQFTILTYGLEMLILFFYSVSRWLQWWQLLLNFYANGTNILTSF